VATKAMDEQDMKECLEEWAHAAKMARKAGFDGVEIHGANGYLLEYFPSLWKLRKDNFYMTISMIAQISMVEALRIELVSLSK